ncbi:glycosyltransferase family 1 protein [Mucilaginibacter sp. dw_454]|uniref:glycosyltransferase family 4 protein n=1 Tax=Mucilaginibacter sp. dw_454 TaxID=2720079 RepID=UPI001BD2AD7E|nr:glycosyltransferase family 1 protein [Mucilaginibacter sp. dw_454]
MPLTIGVDVRDLRVAKTGTRTYLEEVCAAFKQLQTDEIHFKFLDTDIPVYAGSNRVLNLIEHARYQLWKQVGLPLKAFFSRCDIVFCTDNFVPLIHLGYKTIPVFHDAFFFESPEAYGRLWLWLYMKTAIPAARRSPYVVTPTQYAKKQISNYTKLPDSKLAVVPEGPKNLPFTDLGGDDLLDKLSLARGKYILHVGSLFKRKNVPALIHAFSKLRGLGYEDLKLILAGPIPSSSYENGIDEIRKAIEATHMDQYIIIPGYMSDDNLSLLYKNALMYVFPSINEGFGIPILEAFKNDLPVLVANNTCLPEVGGDAVVQFDPFDTNDIFQKIRQVADDEDLRSDLIKKGRARLQDFSWQNTALQLIEIFKKAV